MRKFRSIVIIIRGGRASLFSSDPSEKIGCRTFRAHDRNPTSLVRNYK